jgi:hypothetical protein
MNYKEFEDHICRVYGLSRHMKRPRLQWTGKGKNNMDKLCSLDKCPKKFKPILSQSKFIKSDAMDEEGNLYEIRKYSEKQLKTYRLYSEPIIKVAPSRNKWKGGNPFFDAFKDKEEYNSFIENITTTKWWKRYSNIILDSITHSNRGIYCKDGFIPQSKLTFKWVINKGEFGNIFDGYNRLCIVFKLKDSVEEVIEFKKPKKSVLEFIKDLLR